MDFFAAVTILRVETEFVPNDDPDVIEVNSKAQMPRVKDYEFELNPITFVGKTVKLPCHHVVGEGLK